MSRRNQRKSSRKGIILLVVLSSLAFFSILVAAYLVFSNESRDSSFAIAKRNVNRIDVNAALDEALMVLLRGTDDANNPFYGEDMLSDYYGRNDSLDMQVHHVDDFVPGPQYIGSGFIRFPVSSDGTARLATLATFPYDDVFSGRLVTFTEGALENQTFRVLRSSYVAATGTIPAHDNLFIQIDSAVFGGATPTALQVRTLFYEDGADLTSGGRTFHLNGSPRNSRGLGYETASDTVSATIGGAAYLANLGMPAAPTVAYDAGTNPAVGLDLPVSLQPNHLGNQVDKSVIPGDYDEDYDAADHLNWFLSHRNADGSVTPSFHRPSVLNYLINESTDWSSASLADYRNLIAAISRATYRPLPIGSSQFRADDTSTTDIDESAAINPRFTGSSADYVLRAPLNIGAGEEAELDQLCRALIENQDYDVDNDSDGTPDSIWIDLNLPMYTSPEGRLIRPLIAVMIEDLGGRLNINAVGNTELAPVDGGLDTLAAAFGKTVAEYETQYGTGGTNGTVANEFVFRGLGYGPAEMMFPITLSTPFTPSTAQQTNISSVFSSIINRRYQFGDRSLATLDVPGRANRDLQNLIRFGYRRPTHLAATSIGVSEDPFGRGGIGIGRSGNIVSANTGTVVSIDDASTTTIVEPTINEAINTPYELDPTGVLGGDSPFTFEDFESLLRQFDFDTELLPDDLSNEFNTIAQNSSALAQELALSLTPHSRSKDSPVAFGEQLSPTFSLIALLNTLAGAPLTQEQLDRLMPPEIRLGNKVDVNRAFGNLFDDNGNGIVDEPFETTRSDFDGVDNDGDSTTDETDGSERTRGEAQAYVTRDGSTVRPAAYVGVHPNYVFDSPPESHITAGVANGASGRQLLARHLYVLMMLVTRDLNNLGTAPPNLPVDPITTALTGYSAQAYRANRIAQWAVNVVDYRDPDSIMTAFEYDPDPFTGTGWDVDGNLATVESITFAGATNPRPVVWGVEKPDLVFSESLALHDLRVIDSNRDTGETETKTSGATPDNDTDQARIPQGSLFLELYCPGPVITVDQVTKSSVPQELYEFTDAALGVAQLDLDRLAPTTLGGALTGAPVWRIAISDRHDAASGSTAEAPVNVRDTRPDTASFDLAQTDEIDPTATGTLSIDRFIIFGDVADTDTDPDTAFDTTLTDYLTAVGLSTATDPSQIMLPHQVFYAPSLASAPAVNADRSLQPGQYLTLAPRVTTHLGSQEFSGLIPGLPSNQRYVVSPTEGVLHFSTTSTTATPVVLTPALGPASDYMPALPMVIAAPRPAGWAIADPAHPNLENNVVGISVSEPLPRDPGVLYYPQPTQRYNGTVDQDSADGEDYILTDGYIDFSDVTTNATDTPLDMDPSIGRLPNDGSDPALGTLDEYCTAFLQRLADPTIPFDEVTNPYRTVDWMTIDLTVFSGEVRETVFSASGSYAIRSRQRNGFMRDPETPTTAAPTAQNVLYSYETDVAPDLSLNPTSAHLFEFTGGVSVNLGDSLSTLNNTDATYNPGYVGFLDSLGTLDLTDITNNDRNLSQTPFATHPWLDRPFVSPAELLLVPACSQARLFEEFTVVTGADPEIYPIDSSAGYADLGVFRGGFRHLLNFFYSSDDPSMTAEFQRIFDLVNTRPPFEGEVESLVPSRITTLGTFMDPLRELLSPPFSYLYDNNRVGVLNLNTVSQFQAYVGMMQGHLNDSEVNMVGGTGTATQLSFTNWLESRRGYTPVGGGEVRVTGAGPYNYLPLRLDPNYPTEFAGVVRANLNAPFAINVRNDVLNGGTAEPLVRRGVHAGVLRGEGTLALNDPAAATAPTDDPFFVRDLAQTPAVGSQPHADRFRNPQLRYQTLTRMPNMVSDNSQVFLIRMTLGLFEVDANTGGLGREYNADVGNNQRYRAMYIVDRSIPVGFIPGQDLNARDVVVFESYPE